MATGAGLGGDMDIVGVCSCERVVGGCMEVEKYGEVVVNVEDGVGKGDFIDWYGRSGMIWVN